MRRQFIGWARCVIPVTILRGNPFLSLTQTASDAVASSRLKLFRSNTKASVMRPMETLSFPILFSLHLFTVDGFVHTESINAVCPGRPLGPAAVYCNAYTHTHTRVMSLWRHTAGGGARAYLDSGRPWNTCGADVLLRHRLSRHVEGQGWYTICGSAGRRPHR